MKITVEKREIVGTLKTLLGTYSILDNRSSRWNDTSNFNVIDDEGFDNFISVRGDYVIIPAVVISKVDVKRVVKEGEEVEIPQELLVEQ